MKLTNKQHIKTKRMPTKPKNVNRPWVVKRDNKSNAPTSKGRNKLGDMRLFYSSRRWRSVRLYHLQRNPLCKNCHDVSIIKGADVVDHIQPIRQGGDPYNELNLQSLCKVCHDKKSRTEADSIVYTPQNMLK